MSWLCRTVPRTPHIGRRRRRQKRRRRRRSQRGNEMALSVTESYVVRDGTESRQPWLRRRLAPHGWGGGMFANFFVSDNVCQLCQRIAKYAISIDNFYQKHIKMEVCLPVWGGHTMLANIPFKEHICLSLLYTSVLASPNLSGHLLAKELGCIRPILRPMRLH